MKNGITTMKISDDMHELLMKIKQEYQKRFHRTITLNEIIVQIFVGGIDDRVNDILNECV